MSIVKPISPAGALERASEMPPDNSGASFLSQRYNPKSEV